MSLRQFDKVVGSTLHKFVESGSAKRTELKANIYCHVQVHCTRSDSLFIGETDSTRLKGEPNPTRRVSNKNRQSAFTGIIDAKF